MLIARSLPLQIFELLCKYVVCRAVRIRQWVVRTKPIPLNDGPQQLDQKNLVLADGCFLCQEPDYCQPACHRALTPDDEPVVLSELMAAVLEQLPGVALVFDKFHIIQLMNHRLDELRRELVNEAEGPMKLVIKGTRYLLLTRAINLKEDQLPKLERALKLNEPLSQGWYLKEELSLLWEQDSYAGMNQFLSQWCDRAKQTGVRQLQSWQAITFSRDLRKSIYRSSTGFCQALEPWAEPAL